MTSSELRTAYLKFFESKGHLIYPSDSLVPDDPSLLYTSAGMVQFKPYFVGERVPPCRRIVTCQKCLRTDDIAEVGDAVHHTFFEMLGNFSFGDYFKRESIIWAWEFLTEVLKFNPDHLWTSIYLDDDEAEEIWIKEIGFPKHKIVRLGEDKNYWPANAPSKGPNGPCGPCNEIFLDVKPELGPPEDPTWSIAHDNNRFVEVWNLVFQQFDRQEDGTLKPLPTKNIDTGMGLERTIAVIQGTPTDYETDLFLPIVRKIESMSGVRYGESEASDRCIRVIADHIRSAVFVIGDGVMPSNAGRGSVLRRIIRNAMIKGRKIGLEKDFLAPIVPVVVEIMGSVYREIVDRQGYITKVIAAEEEKFRRTLDAGLERLEDQIAQALASSTKTIDGRAAFTLHDTYGFPIEITREIAAEHGIEVDLEGFEAAMEEQRERAKAASEFGAVMTVGEGSAVAELERTAKPTEFVGYELFECEATIVAIVKGSDLVVGASEGDEVEIVLDRTPFYAESGGQVGDTGRLFGECAELEVYDTTKVSHFFFHKARVKSGSVNVGDAVRAVIDAARRSAIARAHTATHLLHAALRKILGEHALQSGSLVEPDRLRFDFSHFQALTSDELRTIENEVNSMILADAPSSVQVTSLDEARKIGAVALFGEKYGDTVRVVRMGDFSIELCGGTHLCHTSQVGFFKIVSESSIGAGLRRIEAVVGLGAVRYVQNLEDQLREVADILDAAQSEVVTAAQKLTQSLREAKHEIDALKSRTAASAAAELVSSAQEAAGVKYITASVPTCDLSTLRKLIDNVADKLGSGVVVLAGVSDGKVLFLGKVTSDLVSRGFHAGNLLRDVAKVAGGGGGGKPEFAQAGGKDPSKVQEALAKAAELIRETAGATE
ncbi:MAG: alanine--tRNA ligase [Armatimonadota bacterium]|nr:alanine--tRNA ligase [Armatimonadota bacterium]